MISQLQKAKKQESLIFSINQFLAPSVRSPEGFPVDSIPAFCILNVLLYFNLWYEQRNDFKSVMSFRNFLLVDSERNKFASWIKQLNSPHTLNWYCMWWTCMKKVIIYLASGYQ